MMILNYVHKGGTTPPLQIRADGFPLLGPGVLGDGEENTAFFGHASPALLANFNFTEMRFLPNLQRESA